MKKEAIALIGILMAAAIAGIVIATHTPGHLPGEPCLPGDPDPSCEPPCAPGDVNCCDPLTDPECPDTYQECIKKAQDRQKGCFDRAKAIFDSDKIACKSNANPATCMNTAAQTYAASQKSCQFDYQFDVNRCKDKFPNGN